MSLITNPPGLLSPWFIRDDEWEPEYRRVALDSGRELITAPTVTQKHYATLKPEPIEIIEGWALNWYRGNAVKYIARAGKKDTTVEGTIKDLEKAISYLRREVNLLRDGKASW